MNFHSLKFLILSDLYRITSKARVLTLLRYILAGKQYKYIFWMRVCDYCYNRVILRYSIFPITRVILNHYVYKFGISISHRVKIGSGFYIGHFGGIVISPNVTIGKNCNISQGVTIGNVNRGVNKGVPVLGNNVYIGPGAKIIGNIVIGDNVAIGSNCVVTKSMPNNSVVVGVPGKVISDKGSTGYINRIDYDDKINY
jgi:serine O-acetyltransferase